MEATAQPGTEARSTRPRRAVPGTIGPGSRRRIGGGALGGVRRVRPARAGRVQGCPTPRLAQLFESRFALERAAVWRPTTTDRPHDPMILRRLTERWEELAAADDNVVVAAFAAADEEFHLQLSAAAGDPELTLTLADLAARIRAVRPPTPPPPDRVRHAVEDHLDVVDALRRGSVETAARRLDRHLVRSMTAAEQTAAVDLARQIVGRVRLD